MKFYYQVDLQDGTSHGRFEFIPRKRYVNSPIIIADDCAEEFEEKHSAGTLVKFPIKIFLWDEKDRSIGWFKVDKRIEVSYYADPLD